MGWRFLALARAVCAMEYVVPATGLEKHPPPVVGGKRWMEDGLTIVDEDIKNVDDPEEERERFRAELEEYAGHDPIQMLLIHENERQRERSEHNRMVVRIVTVTFTISTFVSFVNVLCIVYNRNLWPTPKRMRRLARRYMRSLHDADGLRARILRGYGYGLVKGEEKPATKADPPDEADECFPEEPAPVAFDPRDGARSRAEELNPTVWAEEVTLKQWENGEPPVTARESDVSSVATSSAPEEEDEAAPLRPGRARSL